MATLPLNLAIIQHVSPHLHPILRFVSLTLTNWIYKDAVQRCRKTPLVAIFGGYYALFQRSENRFGAIGGTAILSLDQSIGVSHDLTRFSGRLHHVLDQLSDVDWVPDLGADIGSRQWFRGLFTCALLCGTTLALAPGFRTLQGPVAAPLEGKIWDESRAQGIAPLAWGSDTGKRMAANNLVVALASTPERPTIELNATLGQGDGFTRVLERAGVARREAQYVAEMIANVSPLSEISPGTVMPLVLGSRPTRSQPRPLQSLDLRARFDLRLELRRVDGQLELTRIPIAVDRTPLHIVGRVGDSLYRSARAAGVPANAVASYLRIISNKMSLDRDVGADAQFDIVVEHARAATGETKSGKLLFAGLTRGSRRVQLLPWTIGGNTEWYEASGVGQKRPGMAQPVSGARVSSGFGMRFHPILGYSRLHRGVDYAAVYGAPVHAVTDGVVARAGRAGGYGNQIRLAHAAGLSSSYSHLSRISVAPGGRVNQGQIIGYVGSTGLSTGPHLHFEVYRNGVTVNPQSVRFSSTSLLNGRQIAEFKARLRAMVSIPLAGSTQRLEPAKP